MLCDRFCHMVGMYTDLSASQEKKNGSPTLEEFVVVKNGD